MHKHITRRELLIKAASLAAAGLAASCAPKAQIVEKVVKETVIVAGTPQVVEKVVTKAGPAAPEVKKIRILIAPWVRSITPVDREVADYMTAHPDVNITLEDAPDGWDTKVLAQVRGGGLTWSANLGDQLNLGKYVETEMIVPVEDYLQSSAEPAAKGILDDFHPLPKADCTYKGRLYGISWRTDCDTFSYNKKMLQAVGMKDAKEWPKTWTGIEELAANVVKQFGKDGVWGMLFPRHVIHGASAIFYTLVNKPWTDDGLMDITNPKYIEALNMLAKWQKSKICPTPPWQDQGGAHMTLFEAGKAAMICTPHIWGKWAAAVQGTDAISWPVPMPPTGAKTPAWATPSFLFRNAPYPKETMDFIIYIFGPKNTRMVTSCIEGRGMPCWKSAYKDIVPKVAGMQWQAELIEFISDAVPIAKTTSLTIQNDKVMARTEEFLLGKIPDAAQAMQMALDDVKKEIDKQKVK